ncbi:MAG TPA: hypothetical protein VE077_21705 [Candidatus Methylomirabilis sp.]|nr:hypothetical protein [Candidatus Methylomirabilis sp.]
MLKIVTSDGSFTDLKPAGRFCGQLLILFLVDLISICVHLPFDQH